MRKILYLHGFNSSPVSSKAQQTVSYFENFPDYSVNVPALPPQPKLAIRLCLQFLDDPTYLGLIGSSLGGYYGMHLHALLGLPLVLINPAARPYELLQDYIGINKNMYSGEEYEVLPEHMHELLDLDTPEADLQKDKLYLLTQTADEVLDYRVAARKLVGCKMHIEQGGDHSFQSFQDRLPGIHRFFSEAITQS